MLTSVEMGKWNTSTIRWTQREKKNLVWPRSTRYKNVERLKWCLISARASMAGEYAGKTGKTREKEGGQQ